MRRIIRNFIAAALVLIPFSYASAVTNTLHVYIKDQAGNPVSSVTVAAIEFGMNGPSTYTQVGLTGSNGSAVLTLENNKGFNLYYSSHGYSPSISDQFNNPAYDPNRYVYTTGTSEYYSTFTVTSGLTGVGRIVQPFIGATADKVLFGGVYNMLSQQQGASGIVYTGAGAGTLVVDNVPFALANTYNVGIYDPEQNKGIGRNVMSDLGDGSSQYPGSQTISYAALNFNQSVPPARVENSAQSGSGSSGASVEGMLVSTGGVAISHMGLGIKACIGTQWNTWANSDENGRFQLYGLTLGVTYYVQAMGGCTWTQNGPGACYAPYSSPGYNAQDVCAADTSALTVASKDIVYVSSDAVYHRIELDEMLESTGVIKVCVKSSSGLSIPNANVNVNPDSSPWPKVGTGCQTHNDFAVYFSSPGFSNKTVNTGATGCADLTGLPSGNYMINVWTPFSNSGTGPAPYNGNGDGFTAFGVDTVNADWVQAHCYGTGVNDYRIAVDTNTAQSLHIYDSSGVFVLDGDGVALSSITYIVSAGGNTSGVVKGTLKFPGVTDLTDTPIMITLYPNCGTTGCPAGVSGNFTAVGGTAADSYPYTINVSSGFSYYMNVLSRGWGRVQRGGGDNSVHMESTGTVTIDMEFARAGAISGTVYKPDGTVFTPANNQWIWVSAGTNNGWTGSQLQKDGTFSMTDALPGVNRISISASGDGSTFNYAVPSPAPTVTVVAGSTATVNLNLVNSNYVGIAFNLAWAPDKSIVLSESDALLGFKVIPLPAGSVIKSETITKMLVGGDEGYNSTMRYSPVTGAEGGPCGNNWPGGFCAASIPSPTVYDFYLVHSGDFGKSTNTVSDTPYPHFTLVSSSRNVIIDDAHAIASVRPAYSMSTASGVLVNLTPPSDLSGRGNATLFGAVSAANFFRNSDYDATGGDFDKFTKYLPVVSLYDANGAFKAAGIVIPSPQFIAQHDKEFDLAFAQGYPAFKNLLDSAGTFGYQIRSLAPVTCYTAVLTTPNYPPYQSRICTGVAGSTTTMSVNLDTAVGAGATLQGVVRDTNSVVLANADVALSGEGIDPRTVVSNSSGAYKFEGLPAGDVRIKVSISGYASGEAEKELSGSSVYTQNFALSAAAGSISGTVYSQKMPFAKVQPGALIYAYNDTYNGNNPALPLPLLKTITGSDGTYSLSGLVAGDTYKVFLKVKGKYTLNQSVTATGGVLPGIDFTMLTKPLDIELFGRLGENAYEFTVLNPQDFKEGSAKWSAAPYNAGAATELNLEKLSSGELRGSIPLSQLAAGITYVLHGNATSYSGKTVDKELLFGRSYKGNADQHIDDFIIGDDSDDGMGRKSNEAPMDKSGGDSSSLVFPAGAMQPVSTAAIPSCTFSGTDKGDASVSAKVDALGAGAFAGNLYTVSLSSVAPNEDKGFDLTLAYDKATADLNDLAVASYNSATAKWEDVPAVATINPVKGTVKVKLKQLASVLAAKRGSAPMGVFNGREYVVRPQTSGTGVLSGTFAVIKPSVAGAAYTGSKLKVFNFPNPFNLKSKTVTSNFGATVADTGGTTIHVEVPAANGGAGHVRIYTLAGELVKDISVNFEAAKHNYVNWDGRNKNGKQVANGVYYGVVELAGKSPNLKDATFKMAVIK
ncbi:MAG: hypothetical protein A2X28_02925 [Elusimicrobia bacterium GWA2_56_46]|nr:MAG: hypothetical protein A2X28_02925 [Elusimicrobia bacterium GWA2_56_46]OGR54182.1 MAG: hypothetical protein A2X39_08870 [Elusimicrobia bacterium GWC2_56_31]HBW21759.1 hypothetical protein [Elusimicrobiota bacterium]